MTAQVLNNGGGIPDMPSKIDLDIEQDTDDGPFIAVTIQDHNTGRLLLDLIIDDVGEADALLDDVQTAVRRYKEAKATES